MRSSFLIAAAFAAGAFGKPLHKSDEVAVTLISASGVTPSAAAPTDDHPSGRRRPHHHPASEESGSAVNKRDASAQAIEFPELPVLSLLQHDKRAASSTTKSAAATKKAITSTSTSTKKAAATTKKAAATTTTNGKQKAASSTSTTKSASKASTAAAAATATTYKQAVLNHHNYHRANHSAPALVWNDGLAADALKVAKTCVFAHSIVNNEGQNIAAGVPAGEISTVISNLFYNAEVNSFNQYGVAQPNTSNFGQWGHFSQVVWKATTSVGCATVTCNGAGGLTNFGKTNP